MEEIRVTLLLVMFAVLAWRDFRTREINDCVFMVFGGLGALLYAFDWQDVTQFVLTMMAGTALGAFLFWKAGLFGTGDLLAVFAGVVIYPVYAGMLPTMLLVLMGGLVLSFMFTITWNVSLNVSDVAKRGGVFVDVTDRRTRKCAAFFLLHRQRMFEKNTFLAEKMTDDGKRKLKFGMKSTDQEFVDAGTTKYVEYACPLMLFSAAAAFALLLADWLLH